DVRLALLGQDISKRRRTRIAPGGPVNVYNRVHQVLARRAPAWGLLRSVRRPSQSRCGKGDRHLEDSEPVPFPAPALRSEPDCKPERASASTKINRRKCE